MLEQQKNETITQTFQGLLVCDGELIPHSFDPTYTLPENASTTQGDVRA